MSRLCKNCGSECVSIYCSKECNRSYKLKTVWIRSKCLTCGKDIISRTSRPKQFCSVKCSSSNTDINIRKALTLKETCLKKYGVKNPMLLKENVEKIKNVMLKKYGVGSYVQTSQFKKDFINTCRRKYGVDYPQQSEIIKNKTKTTVETKYGGAGFKSLVLKEKIKSSMIEKYGIDNPLKCNEIKIKQQKTNIERYGDITPLKNDIIRFKTSKILKEKYGVKNISQLPEIQKMVKESRRKLFIDYLFNGVRLKSKVVPLFDKKEYVSTDYDILYPFKCNICNSDFKDNLYSGNIPKCPVCFPPDVSIQEEEVYSFIRSILPSQDDILRNKRSILSNGLELDIYIPSKNLAIEFDGLYWHSELSGGKSKKYHLNKTIECDKKGIHLIHIFENEWENKKDIIIQKLSHLLNIKPNRSTSIGARKCQIKELSASEANMFLNQHHLQGKDNSSIRMGAYYENELVSVMTFGKRRSALGAKNIDVNEYEMYRFCLGEKHIVGIGSKIFQYFINKYNPSKIITYADRRYSSSDSFYTKIGMTKVGATSPNYWYFTYHDYTLFHRFGFRKSELFKKLKIYDPNLTEWQNMQLNGYDRIWDCGHWKFVWENTNKTFRQ